MSSSSLAALEGGTNAAAENRITSGSYPVRVVTVHPTRWAWYSDTGVEGGEWLPLVGFIAISPGVGMVGTEGDLLQRLIPALSVATAAGAVFCPLVKWGESYIREVAASDGTAYLFAWQTVTTVAGVVTVGFDKAKYYTWLRRFAEMLPEMHKQTAEATIARLAEHGMALGVAAQSNGMMRVEAVAIAKRVQAMRASAGLDPDPVFADLVGEPAAAPAPAAPAPVGKGK